MACVHLARVRGEAGFERYVAVKRMLPTLESDETFVAMFLDEARLAAQIRHPNVVGVLDLDRNEQGPFIVMDFVDGPSLNTVLKQVRQRQEKLPLELALRLMLDLLAGLHAAHELRDASGRWLGIVHRDVSPANVLVGRDGVARITDFGVARAETRLAQTSVGQLKGKLPYMAPEQLRGDVADRRSDVYAAGCVFWELLTLRRAIDGEDHAAIIAAALAGPRTTLAGAGYSVPPELDSVAMASLAPLERRFPSARDFAESLEGAAARSGVRIARSEEVGAFLKSQHPSLLTPERLRPFIAPKPDATGSAFRASPGPTGETGVTHVADAVTALAPTPSSGRRTAPAVLAACAMLALGGYVGTRALGPSSTTNATPRPETALERDADRVPGSADPVGPLTATEASADSPPSVPPSATSTSVASPRHAATTSNEGGSLPRAPTAGLPSAKPKDAPGTPRPATPSQAAPFDPKNYRPSRL